MVGCQSFNTLGYIKMCDMFENKNIFIVLTYKCNAFCKKCMTRYHEKRHSEMKRDTLDYIINFLKVNNYDGTISIGTGEPLLYSDLGYFIKSVLAINDTVNFRILTNGMMLSGDLPSILFGGRCKIGITLDAFYQKSIADLQIGIDLETVKKNITYLCSKYDRDIFYLNYTLSKYNINELIPFCEFALENGIKKIYVTELKIFEGFEEELEKHRLAYDEHLKEVVNDTETLLKNNNVSFAGMDVFRKRKRKECYKRYTASPIIDVDGSVSFCSGHEDLYIGNIKDSDIDKKWNKFAKRLSEGQHAWCQSCHDNILPNNLYRLPKTIRKE